MNKTKLTVIAALTATALASATSFAHQSRGDNMRELFKQLDLEQSQRQQLRAIIKQSRKDTRQQMRKHHSKQQGQPRGEIMQLVQNPVWDEQAVNAALINKQNKRQARAWAAAERKYAMFQVLNPEQKAELLTLVAERQGRPSKQRSPFKHLGKLNLNDQQTTQLKALQSQLQKEQQANQALRQQFRQAQWQLIGSGEFNQQNWQALANQYQGDFQQATLTRLQLHNQAWNLLTGEQQATLAEKMQKRGEKRHKHHSKKHHRHGSEI